MLCHIRGIFMVDGFKLFLWLGKCQRLTVSDIHDPACEEIYRDDVQTMKFNPAQRLSIVYTILQRYWKELLALTAANTLLGLAVHYRRLVFVKILSVFDRQNGISVAEVAVLLAIWQLLALMRLSKIHISNIQESLLRRISTTLHTKTLGIYTKSRSEKFNYWLLKDKIEELSGSIKLLVQITSDALAEVLNVWIVASKIGWRFLIPMLLVFAHEWLSYAVTAKIDRLEKQSRTKITPRICNNFHNMARNIRPVKFYAWERVFRNVRSYLDEEEFVPPLFWRLARLLTEIVGCAMSQIASAIAIMSSIQASGVSSYVEIALLMDSIASLTAFSSTVSSVGTTYINVKQSLAFLSKIAAAKDERYAELIPTPAATPVNLSDCRFGWEPQSFAVHCPSLTIETGEFVTVVGRIGSGKSTLLLGICGEVPLISGQSRLYGRIGYVAQKPPVFDTTFRSNVVMENEYDEKWFGTVVDACALTEDIRQLENGDQTLVGFGGINLSGGQKARLALARALYRRADVYVFDDLLSAVDAHVERHIVKHVLAADGIIGTKTRILVTHAEHVVPLSDKVVTVADGAVDVRKQTAVPFADNADDASEISAAEPCSDNPVGKPEPFAIHPEYKKPPFRKEYLWKFVSLCGYWNIAGMVAVRLVSAYALFYIGGLRISLMADNNPDTIVQSLRHYLLMNALAGVLHRQLMVWSSWIESKTLSKPLAEKMRCTILDTILSLPLTTAEDMSYSGTIDPLAK
ncbi:hypothetical protein IWW42_003528 [Coemansia sp. RSA 1085]|nr:hypothetical protein IWW42_003528 [Coemansia sp. RSA 1085]